MHMGKRIIEVAGRAAAISLVAIILAIALSCGALAASAGDTAAASRKVHELLTSLARECSPGRTDPIPGPKNCAHGSMPSGPAAYARNMH